MNGWAWCRVNGLAWCRVNGQARCRVRGWTRCRVNGWAWYRVNGWARCRGSGRDRGADGRELLCACVQLGARISACVRVTLRECVLARVCARVRVVLWGGWFDPPQCRGRVSRGLNETQPQARYVSHPLTLPSHHFPTCTPAISRRAGQGRAEQGTSVPRKKVYSSAQCKPTYIIATARHERQELSSSTHSLYMLLLPI